jgi:hypothetical protein
MERSTGSTKSTGTGRQFWSALLAAAGAVAGFAGLAYFIGAATLWLALRSSGYSADVAIEHQPRTQVIGLGIRGALTVAAITSVLALVGAVLSRIRCLRWWAKRAPAAPIVFPLAAVVLGASFASWRWLALATALASLVLLELGWLRLRPEWRPWLLLIVLLGSAVTAICWQYGGAVRTTSVLISPPQFAPLRRTSTFSGPCGPYVYWRGTKQRYVPTRPRTLRWIAGGRNPCHRRATIRQARVAAHLRAYCSFPYFGETGKFVYVGSIRYVRETYKGDCQWGASGAIVELPRDEVRLRFTRSKSYLRFHRDHPIKAGVDAVVRFYDHLLGRSD